MSGFRLSIAGMLGLVAIVALGLGSLRAASAIWTMIGATATLGLLLTGVVGACHGRGADRAFWFGFALFGGTYFLIVNWDWFGGQIAHDLTSGLGDLAESLVEPLPPTPIGTGSAPVANPSMSMADRSVKVGSVVQLARMFLSLIFALVGGLTSLAFHLRAAEAMGKTSTGRPLILQNTALPRADRNESGP
jgi:hypothetical protein